MRIARFVHDDTIGFGTVELPDDAGEHPDTIQVLNGDPLVGPVQYTGERLHLDDVRLVAPVIPRSKVVAIGRNYAAHAAEFDNDVPEVPMAFFKPNTSVIGPGEPIVYPRQTTAVDHEAELAVVIGRICKDVPAERAAEVIFGYTCANDVSARDLQKSDGQWARAKGFDTFCPLGPWITTHLSIEEASNLGIRATVTRDGDVIERQDSTTANMVHGIADLVAFVSAFTTLLPGDVILTGTPEGVGRLEPGDVVTVEVDGLGALSNPVVAAEA
ncbi:fumarylacetoacetate hydrolase family protein [Propioniciclava coleopterorum]|uniref:Fumarylacetoacetate hydrolase family protein n=1 Tax=Propioniciclava coleopterorum TaxID=2714937 RepID=A0A6G7Y968_9ACTN|nr:fumarylacetoacetate hydrolase family protein [Propioniciclava coleopterorum]QIK73362.1 fumarylacetoacetate hydrolase family protein [Propioniciclava coleopterorum]